MRLITIDGMAQFLDAHLSANEGLAIYGIVTFVLAVWLSQQSETLKTMNKFGTAFMSLGVAAWWPMAVMLIFQIAPVIIFLAACALPIWLANLAIGRIRGS